MSDFLSQFSGQNTEANKSPIVSSKSDTAPLDSTQVVAGALNSIGKEESSLGIQAVRHDVVVDPNYNRKRALRICIILVVIIMLAVIGFAVWHFSRLVEMPDLVGKTVANAQEFSRQHNITLDVSEEFSLESDGNILSQDVVAGTNIYKDSRLGLTVSKGADPDEQITLPDFSTLDRLGAQEWITKNQADGLSVTQEFSDTVENGKFIRIEFRSSDVSADNYRRREYATVFYSKGAQVFEKNIKMPDLSGQPLADVEAWAVKNELVLTTTEADSDTVEAGSIISQSVAVGEMLAKKDSIAVVVSLGKASVVPNFANFTADNAASADEQIQVEVETRFHGKVAYGKLISQSVAAGTRLKPGETTTVKLVYSLGKPYLKDYRGVTEGELPALFFEDYTSKGANITYKIKRVNSSEAKGTVVAMSTYSKFVSMNFEVTIEISKGNLKPAPEEDKNTTTEDK